MHSSGIRRERRVGKGSTLTSASSLSSRPASTIRPDVAAVTATGATPLSSGAHVKDAGASTPPVERNDTTSGGAAGASARPSNVSAATPGPSRDSGRRHTYPSPKGSTVPEVEEVVGTDGEEKSRRALVPTVSATDQERGRVSSSSAIGPPVSGQAEHRPSPATHDDATLLPILGGSSSNAAPTHAGDMPACERRSVKILRSGVGAAQPPPVSNAEWATNATRREGQSVWKMLKLAELDSGSQPPSRGSRSLAGLSSSLATSRQLLPLLPSSSHVAPAEPAIRKDAKLPSPPPSQEEEAEEEKKTERAVAPPTLKSAAPRTAQDVRNSSSSSSRSSGAGASVAASPSQQQEAKERTERRQRAPPRPQSLRGDAAGAATKPAAKNGKTQKFATVAATTTAPATPHPPPPSSTNDTYIPLSSSPLQPPLQSPPARQSVAYSGGTSVSTTDYYMGVSYYYPEDMDGDEDVKEKVQKVSAQPSSAAVTPATEAAAAAAAAATCALTKPVSPHKHPHPPPSPSIDETEGEEEEEERELTQAAFSYFGSLPDGLTPASKKPMRDKHTSSAQAAERWAMAAALAACPSTTAAAALPRGHDARTNAARSGSHASEASFSLFPAYQMSCSPTMSPAPSVTAVELTHPAQRELAVVNAAAEKYTHEMSSSAFTLLEAHRGGRGIPLEKQQHLHPAVHLAGHASRDKLPLLSSDDNTDAFANLLYTDWTSVAPRNVAGSGASQAAHHSESNGPERASMLVEALTEDVDSDSDVSATDTGTDTSVPGGDASVVELASVVAGTSVSHPSSISGSGSNSSSRSTSTSSRGRSDDDGGNDASSQDTCHSSIRGPSATATHAYVTLIMHAARPHEEVVYSHISDTAAALEMCRETKEGEDSASATNIHHSDDCVSSPDTTTAVPSSAFATKPLAPTMSRRQTHQVIFADADEETPEPNAAQQHPSPHLLKKVAATASGGGGSTNTSISAYYTAAASTASSASLLKTREAPEKTDAENLVLLRSHSGSSSLTTVRDSDSFALSFLEGIITFGAAGADKERGKPVRSNAAGAKRDDAMDAEAGKGKEKDVEQGDTFSIDSSFADREQAAAEHYNYTSLWSSSVLGSGDSTSDSESGSDSDSNSNRDNDESVLDELLRMGHSGGDSHSTAGDRSNAAVSSGAAVVGSNSSSGGVGGGDTHRPRRLLPVSDFRHYYVPEDFITESRISATYKVRERRTRRHLAATFVLKDPGYRGTAAAALGLDVDAAGRAKMSEKASEQPMSLDLKRFCALSLVLQHPNLVQTFDVFYRDAQDAGQLQSLVQAITGASGDAALTWGPEIVPPVEHVRTRPRVSLRLPAVAADGEVAAGLSEAQHPASQRSSAAASMTDTDSVAGRSASLHSTEHRPPDRNHKTKSKKKKSKSGDSSVLRGVTVARESAQYSSGNSLLRRLFSNPLKSSSSGGSEVNGDGDGASRGSSTSGTSATTSLNATPMARERGEREGETVLQASGTVAGFQWPAEAAARLARRERRVAELRASRSAEDRAKKDERRSRIEHLAKLLVSGRVVAVLVSELVKDDTEAEGPAPASSLLAVARREAGLPVAQLMSVTREVADALRYLHSFRAPWLSLIHGAVVPRNMMLDTHGVVKLVNYTGMHWWMSDTEGVEKKGKGPEKGMGTAAHLGGSAQNHPPQRPQLLQGWSHAFDLAEPAADMYGLGCALLTLSTGMQLGYARQLYNANTFPVDNPSLQSLLKGLLVENPSSRMTAEEVLRHPFASTSTPESNSRASRR
jgi:hypothetical protein